MLTESPLFIYVYSNLYANLIVKYLRGYVVTL